MKKILINIIVILLFIFIFDFFVFYIDSNKYAHWTKMMDCFSTYIDSYKRNPNKDFLYQEYIVGSEYLFKPLINESSKKKPILLFGCSFAYGHSIPEEKTFGQVLGKYTKRPIYNRSHHGFGVQQMVYQLENEDFYKIVPQPEYIIYTIIDDHIRRMYLPVFLSIKEYNDIFYEKKDGKLYFKENTTFHRGLISFIRIKQLLYDEGLYLNNKQEKIEFLQLHLQRAKECVDKHWKGTKFIILQYNKNDTYLKPIENDLKKLGFIIINRDDIAPFDDFDTNYCLGKQDPHPNDKAWEYIVPRLMKALESKEYYR